MRVTPERAEQIAWPIIEIYSGIQTEILENIGSVLAQNKDALEDDANKWQVMKLEQIGGLTRENVKVISKKSGLAPTLIRKTLSDIGFEGVQQNEILLQRALKRGAPLLSALPVKEDPAIMKILDAFERQSIDSFNLINVTLLRESENVYRDILTNTAAQVITGMRTPQQALRSAVRQWALRGIPALITANGGRRYAEEYAYTVIRTMGNKVTNEMQEARFDSYGVDLVEISSHEGARPNCAPYQGRIYSRSGNDPKYPSLYGDTSIGEPDGLFGINCGHFQYPYIPEVSEQRYKPMNAERNEIVYENSQKQRELERSIRNNKRELAALEKMNDEEGAKMAKRKVLDSQARLRTFIGKTGRTRRREREQLYN
ncbi:minor capsid protein [Bacillus vallismortis]|uniref:phage minor capsid protein n=1 Tax=Bacillus vallismortis TaxID=72361 RepID=UPI000C2A87EE|nr:phage minor capsid protein [Bacillus vallismortis]PJZ00373.1 minor capsid protein [Bacillus vallismortis]